MARRGLHDLDRRDVGCDAFGAVADGHDVSPFVKVFAADMTPPCPRPRTSRPLDAARKNAANRPFRQRFYVSSILFG